MNSKHLRNWVMAMLRTLKLIVVCLTAVSLLLGLFLANLQCRSVQEFVKPIEPAVTKHRPYESTNHTTYRDETKCAGLYQWIVVTADSAQVMDTIQKVNVVLGDWCLLVLEEAVNGGNSTPFVQNDHFIFLSTSTQIRLPFVSVQSTSWNSFGRKSLGYLYAIANGARVILDGDGNNIPSMLSNSTILPVEKDLGVFERGITKEDTVPINWKKMPQSTKVWNPCPYLEGSNSWPRGFPQELFTSIVDISKMKSQPTLECRPIVQQYYVRIADKRASRIVSPRAVFSPYTAHSSVHLYEAFWSLLLPMTVNDRVADILRSYIAQSLFYLIPDACLMFTPLDQNVLNGIECLQRNQSPLTATKNTTSGRKQNVDIQLFSHNYSLLQLVDSLYYLPLSTEFDSFDQVLREVYEYLHHSGAVGEEDVKRLNLWIKDLTQMGYQFPKLPKRSSLWTNRMKLCVMFNSPPLTSVVRILLAYYLRFFTYISLFVDGVWTYDDFSFVPSSVGLYNCSATDKKGPRLPGGLQQTCLAHCVAEPQVNMDGYIFVADDILLNLSMLVNFLRDKVWRAPQDFFTPQEARAKGSWKHWNRHSGYSALLKVIDSLPARFIETLHGNGLVPNVSIGRSDFVFIPIGLATNFSEVLSLIIGTTEVFCEIAIPLAINSVANSKQQFVIPTLFNLVKGNRVNLPLARNKTKENSVVHPLKLSQWALGDVWREGMLQALRYYTKLSHSG